MSGKAGRAAPGMKKASPGSLGSCEATGEQQTSVWEGTENGAWGLTARRSMWTRGAHSRSWLFSPQRSGTLLKALDPLPSYVPLSQTHTSLPLAFW